MIHRPEHASTGGLPLSRKLNFLLVDDDDICLFIHRRVLDLTGYCNTAQSASNGSTALEILMAGAEGRTPVPDVILLDLEMPVMNGIQFLEAFRHMNYPKKEHIAIVLLTSSVSGKDLDLARSLGVAHFLSKPLTKELLDATVSKLYNYQRRDDSVYRNDLIISTSVHTRFRKPQ